MDTTIEVFYSCALCGLERVGLRVPERADEDVAARMDATILRLARDHRRRSPECKAKELKQLMIPMTGRAKVGGPVVQ